MKSITLKLLSFVFVTVALNSTANAGGDYGVGNGGDQLDWARPRSSCPHHRGECRSTHQGELARACVQALVDNYYPINESRAAICSSTASWKAVEAIRTLAQARQGLADSTLQALASIVTAESTKCVQHLVSNRYSLDGGNRRAEICAGHPTYFGLEALADVANAGQPLSDSSLLTLTRIWNATGAACIRSLVSNYYPIGASSRAEICSQVTSNYAISAIQTATGTRQDISASTLRALGTISNKWAAACVATLAKNYYRLNEGRRAEICSTFCSQTQVATLESIANSNQPLSESTLESIARIR
jgi:hypothetical protein